MYNNKLIVPDLTFLVFIIFSLTCSVQSQNFPKDYVNAHNSERSRVKVKPLSWNSTIAKHAQAYVDKEVAKCDKLEHSYDKDHYGENLAVSDTGEINGVQAVKLWVEEKHYFDYGGNKCVGGECQHYTQVVWKDSTQLGCGKAKCKNGWWLVCCNYYPAGNVPKEWPY